MIMGGPDVIPKSIQLLAGRTGQEYNHRKKRNGAFWQDRYHATAVETGEYLKRCMVYIDLNMVRTGMINHPSQWKWSGYNEIQKPRRKNILIDYEAVSELSGFESFEIFQSAHKKWINDSLANDGGKRKSHWTDSVAIGNHAFVKETFSHLGAQAKGRSIVGMGDVFQIREEIESYNALFGGQKRDIAPKNAYDWM